MKLLQSACRHPRFVLLLAACLCVLATGRSALRWEPIRLRVEVTSPTVPVSALSAHLVHAGITTNLSLSDDGAGADRKAGDGTWTATWQPQGPVGLLPLRLAWRSSPSAPWQEVYSGTEPLTFGENYRSWAIVDGTPPVAHPYAHPGSRDDVTVAETWWMSWNMAFAVAALLVVLLIARRHVPVPVVGGGTEDDARPPPAWVDALFWLALSLLWTWPAALGGPGAWVGRHFDTPSTIWVIHAAPRLLRNLVDVHSEWPVGADYSALDSFLLLPISAALDGVHPGRIQAWFQILGIALSGWAAQGFARGAGVRSPWDVLAGIGYACSGVMASVLLEGQVYHALNPWLPLFGWAFWRTTAPSAGLRDGLSAAGAFGLCLATSGYVGVSAALLGAGLLIGALLERKSAMPWRPVGVVAISGGVMVLLYAFLFTDDTPLRRDMSLTSMRLASAHLSSLAGPTPEVDRAGQSLSAAISPVCLAWLAVALASKRRMNRGRTLFWTAFCGLLIAMGPVLALGPDGASIPSPVRLIVKTPLDVILRFPQRSLGVWNLCAGIVAFAAAGRQVGSRTGPFLLVGLLVVLHAFLVIRLPDRQTLLPFHVPSAYRHAGGPVLDVFPETLGVRQEMWFKARACSCQIEHGWPIADNCVSTQPGRLPRMRLNWWLRKLAMEGKGREAALGLAGMGFAAVALHADHFPPDERALLEDALRAFGTERFESTDGGERLVLQRLPTVEPPPSPAQRKALFEATVIDRVDAGIDGARVAKVELAIADGGSRMAALAGWSLFALIALGWIRTARRRDGAAPP